MTHKPLPSPHYKHLAKYGGLTLGATKNFTAVGEEQKNISEKTHGWR